MKRSLVLLLAPVLLGGCRNSPQAMDPFLPRTTVPPPSTGSAVGAPAPYYPGAAGPAPAASPGSLYTPPGGSYNYPAEGTPMGAPGSAPASPQPTDRFPMTRRDDATKQSSNATLRDRMPTSIRSSLAESNSIRDSAVKPASAELAVGQSSTPSKASSQVKIVRVVDSGNRNIDDQSATNFAYRDEEPGRLPAADDAIDIMDLPPARTAANGLQGSRRVALASYEESGSARTSASDSQSQPTSHNEEERYAFDRAYLWLKGQLEYSLVDRRWKLRYIPIDGETDHYGGSVVLEGEIPAEFQPGDFVVVRGALSGDAAPAHFAPNYRFDSISASAD